MTILKRILISLILSIVSIASPVFAQNSGLNDPLRFNDIPTFIAGALKVLVIVALPIITLFIVYSGFLFVLARGKPDALTKARENFIYVVIGSILILGAWVIATLIGGTVSQLVAP
jgi:hypothetical protein